MPTGVFPAVGLGFHPCFQFSASLGGERLKRVEVDDLLQVIAAGGLSLEVVLDVGAVDAQLLADVT